MVLTRDQNVYLDFKIDSKRVRVFNGSKFQINLYPNRFPFNERINQGNILAAQIYSKLLSGFNPNDIKVRNEINTSTDIEVLEKVVLEKISNGVSDHYKRQLKYTFKYS